MMVSSEIKDILLLWNAQEGNSLDDSQIVSNIDISESYEKLKQLREYILSLDWYGFTANFIKIQENREWFHDMIVEELLEIFTGSSKSDWQGDISYFFALFEVIEKKLEEKGINLWFQDLFITGI